ncbi:MAG: hypothetical protein J6U04_11325 [Salinivirgaceae bacterium]|nr:hypothetical protein [Salinivirgaceae bacterium]
MRKLVVILMVMVGLQAQAQVLVPKGKNNPDAYRLARYSFCVSLMPTSGLDAVSYGIHCLTSEGKATVRFVTYESFLRQFGGAEPSKANPDRIDMFEAHGIDQFTIKDLWKLRYAVYPFGDSKAQGWGGQNGVPTSGQMQILSQYGLEYLGSAIYGDNLIRLLKNMQDTKWVGDYMNAK